MVPISLKVRETLWGPRPGEGPPARCPCYSSRPSLSAVLERATSLGRGLSLLLRLLLPVHLLSEDSGSCMSWARSPSHVGLSEAQRLSRAGQSQHGRVHPSGTCMEAWGLCHPGLRTDTLNSEVCALSCASCPAAAGGLGDTSPALGRPTRQGGQECSSGQIMPLWRARGPRVV